LLIFMESMIEVLKAEMQDIKEKQAGSANKTEETKAEED